MAWQVTPARHSIALREVGSDTKASAVFLREGDRELADAPPLAFDLRDDELAAIRADGACHATDYGPGSQDKHTNEDFALAAVLPGPNGERHAFAAVADGVSNGSFFAERGARLACLAGLRAVAGELAAGADPGAEAERERFRGALHGAIVAALAADLETLKAADAAPGGWAPDTFGKYRGEEERWYRTTLLLAVLGPRGGFVSVTGDGGVRGFVVAAGAPAETVVERTLLSAGGGPIERCVSLHLRPDDLTFAQISTAERAAVHLVLASDGLDLSMGRIAPAGASLWRDLPLETSPQAAAFLTALAQDECAERDNLSVARASWPLDEDALAWGAWGRVPIETSVGGKPGGAR